MSQWPIRILHLGLGRFHRAHQAVYYQNLFEKYQLGLGVVAFSMRSPDARNQLRAVDCRYPICEFSKTHTELKWISCIQEVYFIKEDIDQYLKYFADANVELVTLTVTEKAYASDELATSLIQGLQERKKKINKGLTILSCDNLQGNGTKLKNKIFSLLNENESLKLWVSENVSFPNSMVDRIVPALSHEKSENLQKRFGIRNREILATEEFSQWIVEDSFKLTKPPLELVGVQWVQNVEPYEKIKLQLLNASHSLIAYRGLLKGYEYVHQAIRDLEIKGQVLNLFSEVMPLLACPPDFDFKKYTDSLIDRFDNEKLPHQLKQIAMDGSQKLQQRIFPSYLSSLKENSSRKFIQSVILFWVEYCFKFSVDDPLQKEIENIKRTSQDQKDFKEKILHLILGTKNWMPILRDLQ